MGLKQQIKHIVGQSSGIFRMHTQMDPHEARDILEAVLPCPTGLSYANNTTRIDYDLHIIIPAYNSEQYIVECLDSLTAQETDYRCLATIVNDGSTDATWEVLTSYVARQEHAESVAANNARGGQRVALECITQENRGPAGARNAALQCICGEYIMFLDPDDVLPPGTIQHMMDMAHETNADLVQGSWYDFVTGAEDSEMHILPVDGLLTGIDGVYAGYQWGKLYRHTVLEHFRFPEGFWYEDTPVSFILFALPWRFAATRELVYGYRYNPNGIVATGSRGAKALDSYWITERCLEEFPSFGVRYDQRAYEYFIRQVVTNWCRAKHQPRKVREAMFVLEAGLRDQYFADSMTEVEDMKTLEDAIRNRQFVRYEMLMMGR